jgi:hypothetical protein
MRPYISFSFSYIPLISFRWGYLPFNSTGFSTLWIIISLIQVGGLDLAEWLERMTAIAPAVATFLGSIPHPPTQRNLSGGR